MAISRRLLNEGEHVVTSERTHAKALLAPALWLSLVSWLTTTYTVHRRRPWCGRPAAGRRHPVICDAGERRPGLGATSR